MTNANIANNFKEFYTRWEQSGLSRTEFCKLEDVKYSWFMYHQKRMRRKKRQAAKLNEPNSGQGFEQVQIPAVEKNVPSVIEFHYPDGRYFLFAAGTPAVLIKEIVA